MRVRLFAGLAAALILAPAVVLCAPAQDRTSDAQSPPPAAAQDAAGNPNTRLLTPQQEGRQGVVKGVAEQPLRDLNIIRSKIPPVLQQAMIDPYERPQPNDCQGITAQVRILYDALGPDYDEPVSTEHPGLVTRGKGAAKSGALDAMRSGEQAYIPFDGFIRFLSGAERHDRVVLAAIQAGATRRAYLKGQGEIRGCAPPAVPRHLAHPATVANLH
jgi:hypothetical protein